MDNEVKIQFKNSITGEKKLEKYKETLTQINSVLSGLDTKKIQDLKSGANDTKDMAKDIKNMSEKTNAAFNYTTVRAFTRGLQRLTQTIGGYINKSSAFYENLNLLRVAFDGNTEEADKFVNKLSEMYGLDESWGYRTVGIFKQLANSMGIANEMGTKMSKTLTQLSIDVSSLYNIDTDRAVSILSSALAGQTKPARSIGGDITQQTLQMTLDKAGIDRSITQLSYAEKRLVIITTLLGQLKNATDDWGKTLDSPANQTRILSEQWERLTRALGNIFLPIVYKILPYVNGILMVLTEIAKIIGNIMAKIFGFKPEDLDFGSGVGQDLDIFGEKADNATAKTEKLKKSVMGLRSFDKIINISTPKNNGSGAGAGATGISSDILNMANKAMDSYNKKLKNVKLQATEIRDKIMEWLGFTKIVDEKTREVSFKFDHITSGTVLGGLAVGGVIFKGVHTIYKVLSKIGLLKFPKFGTIFTSLKGISSVATKLISGIKFTSLAEGSIIIGGIIFSAKTLQKTYKANEEFRKKVDNVKKSIKNFGETLSKIKEKLVPVLQELWDTLQPVIEPIINLIKKLGDVVTEVLENVVIRYFTIAIDTISGLLDIIGKLVDGDVEGALKRFGQMIKDVAGDWLKAFENIKKAIIKFVPNAIKELGKILIWVQKLPLKFLKFIGEAVYNIYLTIITTDWIEMGKNILTGIVTGLLNIGKKVAEFGGKIYDKIKESLSMDNIKKLGGKILNWLIDGFSDIGGKLSDWGSKFAKEVEKAIKNPIKSAGKAGKSAFFGAFGVLGGTVAGLFKATGGVYSGGKWHDIQRYDGGGMPNSGQLFWARENGLPEMVGTIGGHTAVMNNDQIVGSVANGVYRAVLTANSQTRAGNGNQVFNIYLDKNKKLATYTLNELQSMAKSNGSPIEIS